MLKSSRPKPAHVSYAQCGEDLIVKFVLDCLHIEKPTYLDVGCFDPFHLSNTALFYEQGSRGVCVEPDPDLFAKIAKYRKGDKCLNIGIGISDETSLTFYQMNSQTLNTFSKETAEMYEKETQYRITKTVEISVEPINIIISQHFQGHPNFISIDVEGLDLEILQSMDFNSFKTEVFCVETLTFSENNTEEKIQPIIDFMESKGYFVYADTYINTIFVRKEAWEKR